MQYALVMMIAVIGCVFQGRLRSDGQRFATIPIRPAKNTLRKRANRPARRKGRFPSGFA